MKKQVLIVLILICLIVVACATEDAAAPVVEAVVSETASVTLSATLSRTPSPIVIEMGMYYQSPTSTKKPEDQTATHRAEKTQSVYASATAKAWDTQSDIIQTQISYTSTPTAHIPTSTLLPETKLNSPDILTQTVATLIAPRFAKEVTLEPNILYHDEEVTLYSIAYYDMPPKYEWTTPDDYTVTVGMPVGDLFCIWTAEHGNRLISTYPYLGVPPYNLSVLPSTIHELLVSPNSQQIIYSYTYFVSMPGNSNQVDMAREFADLRVYDVESGQDQILLSTEMLDVYRGETDGSTVIGKIEWAPGTNKILFNTTGNHSNFYSKRLYGLHVLDIASLEHKVLLPSDYSGGFTISPSGEKILLYFSNRVSVADVDGSNQEVLFEHEPMESYPDCQSCIQRSIFWRHDSNSVIHIEFNETKEHFSIYEYFIDGSSPPKVHFSVPNLPYHHFFVDEYAFSPDQSHFGFSIVSEDETESTLYIYSLDGIEKLQIKGQLVILDWWLSETEFNFYSGESIRDFQLFLGNLNGDIQLIKPTPYPTSTPTPTPLVPLDELKCPPVEP